MIEKPAHVSLAQQKRRDAKKLVTKRAAPDRWRYGNATQPPSYQVIARMQPVSHEIVVDQVGRQILRELAEAQVRLARFEEFRAAAGAVGGAISALDGCAHLRSPAPDTNCQPFARTLMLRH